MTMNTATSTRYALIDNCSGYLWGVTEACDPVAACARLDNMIGGESRMYEDQPGMHASTASEEGYHVYEIPADFVDDDKLRDGQDNEAIALVESWKKVAYVATAQMDSYFEPEQE
ncbi:hypothetical protein [Microvirga arabica]|uniref:hypothetical protein n=1 Tax=Microvirga arabica TaxID=1128671 RepID=UPI001939C59E|nr:hypothetical protein [Microvirga arabica]MBM1170192.1 hypothetical protein [Microvirga arabica]